mmetsp:Transcript_20854/g.47336  ORF Transcript_20854/g.47336 Transcript_20854/m.47336 type:complete len:122 (+) Transcript_20854:761-1126(+)
MNDRGEKIKEKAKNMLPQLPTDLKKQRDAGDPRHFQRHATSQNCTPRSPRSDPSKQRCPSSYRTDMLSHEMATAPTPLRPIHKVNPSASDRGANKGNRTEDDVRPFETEMSIAMPDRHAFS